MTEPSPTLRVLYAEAKNKSEITREARDYARLCDACGQFTTAERIRHLADWIDVQLLTIREQKLLIYELRKVAGDKVRPPVGWDPARQGA